MFFVIGSRNSSNSKRLVEVASKAGCNESELIHSESEIPLDKIGKCKTIGISSGASAPEIIVQDFICLLYTSPSPRDRTRSRMPSSA